MLKDKDDIIKGYHIILVMLMKIITHTIRLESILVIFIQYTEKYLLHGGAALMTMLKDKDNTIKG